MDSELPSFENFFKKAHYNSELVFPGYQSREDFLKDFEQKFGTCDAYKQIETFYNWVVKTMEEATTMIAKDLKGSKNANFKAAKRDAEPS